MKLIINKNQLSSTIENFLQRVGYKYLPSSEKSFVRPLSRNNYPRFHVYINIEDEKIIFNLHIDQKEVSYKNAHMHNAEYDGKVVAGEIYRLKKQIENQLPRARKEEEHQIRSSKVKLWKKFLNKLKQ